MKPTPFDPSRRAFVRQACCAAVGSTGILSALGQLRVMAAVAGDSLARSTAASVAPDFKALVCLYLSGGIDATNLIVPSDASSYAAYAAARSELAVTRSSLLPIAPKRYADGRTYGLHESAPELQALFASGKLAAMANVGVLVRPTTLADYTAGKNLPPQLFSHSDQTFQWQSSIPDRPSDTGWGGRLADLLDALNSNNQISMSISMNGSNTFQRGRSILPMSLFSGGPEPFTYSIGSNLAPRQTAMNTVLNNPSPNALAAAFGDVTKKAISDSSYLGGVLNTAPTLKAVFPGTNTAVSLKMVAKMISISQNLGLRRQIFFVQVGGWDMHGAQATAFGPLVAEISGAMKAFYDATVELGVANQVTTFTASDFGRTYIPNAGGTDHGWGNHQFIMGGAVQGGDIYGTMPSLTVGANDDTGRGRWIPTTSVDEYNATLSTWFGVLPGNLPVVLPNIGRFARPNLGFMG